MRRDGTSSHQRFFCLFLCYLNFLCLSLFLCCKCEPDLTVFGLGFSRLPGLEGGGGGEGRGGGVGGEKCPRLIALKLIKILK